MNNQTSEHKVPSLVLDGVQQGIVRGKDMAAETKPLQFAQRRGELFDVEHTIDGNDFILHFFIPQTEEFWTRMGIEKGKRSVQFAEHFWEMLFPVSLDEAARDYFKAEFPRLSATHVVEKGAFTQFGDIQRPLDSWWMRAKGFANRHDPEAYLNSFYLRLEGLLVSNRNRT